MTRVLVTGSNGLLGQNLLSLLVQNPDYEVFATSRSDNVYPNLQNIRFIKMDLTQKDFVRDWEKMINPDVIIHCAAMTQVDPCELDHEAAWDANVEATLNVALLAERSNSKIIYISTDFVFSGSSGPYSENDTPEPVNYYGFTKMKAEELISGLTIPRAIVRTILVYGITPAMSRSNLVLWVKSSLESGKSIRVVNDQYRMPTLVNDLADGIVSIVERQKEGIYHLSGPELQSVYELAIETARFFDLDEGLISPVSSKSLNQPGVRPVSTGFILDKAVNELDFNPKSFREGLSVVQNLLVNL